MTEVKKAAPKKAAPKKAAPKKAAPKKAAPKKAAPKKGLFLIVAESGNHYVVAASKAEARSKLKKKLGGAKVSSATACVNYHR